jgi:uncharacterized protein (DUF697 family)/tellurite resistance protein
MNEPEQKAVLAVCILAAFADGSQSDLERDEIKRIADGFAAQNPNLAATYQEVLLKKVSLADIARQISSKELRSLAYEMAVCVCHADGVLTDDETAFLSSLRNALQLESAPAAFHEQAATIAATPLESMSAGALLPNEEAELDRSILNYAILTGALEIMPYSLATMAIIPLQMKMVYGIGKRYGFALSRGHIKDLLATLGVGLTSQVMESCARKIVGGLFGGLGGGLLGGLASQATGSAVSFASTYALGQVAKQYYAGGRSLTGAQLKQVFASLLSEGKSLQSNYAGDIAQKARSIGVADLVPLGKAF